MSSFARMEPAFDDPIRVPPLRDPQALLVRTRREWGGRSDLWVFGYASLLWRPEFEALEHRPAQVHGWHRALRMASRVNRGHGCGETHDQWAPASEF